MFRYSGPQVRSLTLSGLSLRLAVRVTGVSETQALCLPHSFDQKLPDSLGPLWAEWVFRESPFQEQDSQPGDRSSLGQGTRPALLGPPNLEACSPKVGREFSG